MVDPAGMLLAILNWISPRQRELGIPLFSVRPTKIPCPAPLLLSFSLYIELSWLGLIVIMSPRALEFHGVADIMDANKIAAKLIFVIDYWYS